jgi:hypothetical protein
MKTHAFDISQSPLIFTMSNFPLTKPSIIGTGDVLIFGLDTCEEQR